MSIVQVQLLKKMRPYNIGEVIGVTAEVAKELIAEDGAVIFKQPKDNAAKPLASASGPAAAPGTPASTPKPPAAKSAAKAKQAAKATAKPKEGKKMMTPPNNPGARMRVLTKPANMLAGLLNKGAEAAAPAVAQAAATEAAVEEKKEG